MKFQQKIKALREKVKLFKKQKNINLVIRTKAIIAHLQGRTAKNIANYFDVSEKTIKRWIFAYNEQGIDGLSPKEKAGRPPKLNETELQALRSTIIADQERVWLARHVLGLIMIMFAVMYSVKYIPEILKKINLSFHKAVHYLVKKNEEKRSEWIKERLPKIYEEHIKQGWRIFFQDEVGFQTEGTLAYSWGEKGKSIVVKNKGRHGRVNLMGVYEVGSGEFFGKLTNFRVNASRFRRFLCCLKRKYRDDKFIIIADNASFHKAKWFTEWWKESDWLRLEFLPAYSPDFNPIERLWKWIKREFTHNKCWNSKSSLWKYLQNKLAELPDRVEEYIGTMQQELLRLKSAFQHYDVPFIWDKQLTNAA